MFSDRNPTLLAQWAGKDKMKEVYYREEENEDRPGHLPDQRASLIILTDPTHGVREDVQAQGYQRLEKELETRLLRRMAR